MNSRLRKLLGGIAILAFLVLYAWAAVAVWERLPDAFWISLIYFTVVGIGWGVPIIPLMTWMHRADPKQE